MNKSTAKELLQFQLDMGVDEIIGSVVTLPDTWGKKQKTAAATKPVANMPEMTQAMLSPATALRDAKKAADKATTLNELKQALLDFKGLAIQKTAQNMVFADGNPNADIMVIGEAPGAHEDQQAIPFCGESGQILDRFLHFIGMKREANLYISNVVFWRPPGNRKPTTEELTICRPFIEKHIALKKPKILLFVGSSAACSLLDTKKSIGELRGKKNSYSCSVTNQEIPCFVLFHPSYLMRQPSKKKLFWQDLLKIQSIYENASY